MVARTPLEKTMALLLLEKVRDRLDYEPLTGRIFWKISPMWAVKVGDEAGCVMANGYRWIRVAGKFLPAQDIAFALHHGRWPKAILDHEDHDRLNNRPDNLIEAGSSGNNRNRLRQSKTGLRGVVKRDGRFIAQISVDNHTRFLGRFDDKFDAARAYDVAALAHGGPRAPTNASLGLLA